MKDFKISVIMSVYNVEPWINEAVDSVINQTMDFEENIQIVFVDDGSIDNSGKICDEYKEKYPENIEVIHKENEGLAKARLTGLPYTRGEYINFFDPDDILSKDVMAKVIRFFEAYQDSVDIVSIPMINFGAITGPHPLNGKFSKGTRLIDLLEEWECIQLSLASAFIRRSALEDFDAETEIRTAEDAKEIIKILVRKNKLGVVSNCKYLYRRRDNSSVGGAQNDPAWYIPYLQKFSCWALDYAKEKLGYIPKYIQNIVLYDLQWKIRLQKFLYGVLSESEVKEFRKLFFSLPKYFDDYVILNQKHLYIEHKIMLFRMKYGIPPKTLWVPEINNIYLYYPGSCFSYELKEIKFVISIVEIEKNELIIYGFVNSFCKEQMVRNLFAWNNGENVAAAEWYFPAESFSIGEPILFKQYFRMKINLERTSLLNEISFQMEYDFGIIFAENLFYGEYSTVHPLDCCFFNKDGWLINGRKKSIIAKPISKIQSMKTETDRVISLWRKKRSMTRKAAVLRTLVNFCSLFKNREIWLISDRMDRASDNGEAFFQFLCKYKPRKIKPVYALQKSSSDWERIKQTGMVVDFDSHLYKIIFLLADKVISTCADYYVMNPFGGQNIFYHDWIRNKPFIFLQHGVTKDDVSSWLGRFNKNIKGFITAAYPEYDSIVNGNACYTEKEVWLTGFARFDRLYRDSKKKITFMPTWRRYLFGNQLDEHHYLILKPGFEDSSFFKFYNELLNNGRLIKAAKEHGYELQLFIHPNMMNSLEHFHFCPDVKVLHKDTEYRVVYAESDLVLTDYSSAVFDFAYLRQPIIYMQFDAEEFFKGDHVYQKGYFDYEQNGFGEVEYDVESTVDRIIEYMENGCQIKPKYKKRIDNFFAFRDQNNCERIFQRIRNM